MAEVDWFHIVGILIMDVLFLVPMLWYRMQGGMPKLRALPQFAGGEELISACAETGRPVLINVCNLHIERFNYSIPTPHMVWWTAGLCAKYGVRMLLVGSYTSSLMQCADHARAGFADAGRPELFVMDDVIFLEGAHGGGINMAAIQGLFKEHDVGAIFYFPQSGNQLPLGVYAYMNDIYQYGNSWGYGQFAQILTCDYANFWDEVNYHGAYFGAQRNPAFAHTILGTDLVRWGLVILVIVSLVLVSMGVEIPI